LIGIDAAEDHGKMKERRKPNTLFMSWPKIGIPFKGGPLSGPLSGTVWNCQKPLPRPLIRSTRPANQRIGTARVVTQANESCNRLSRHTLRKKNA